MSTNDQEVIRALRSDIQHAQAEAKRREPDYPWSLGTAAEAVWVLGESLAGTRAANTDLHAELSRLKLELAQAYWNRGTPKTPTSPVPALSYEQRKDYACEVCSNVPDEEGRLEHGRGCYTQSSDGGGSSRVEFEPAVLTVPDSGWIPSFDEIRNVLSISKVSTHGELWIAMQQTLGMLNRRQQLPPLKPEERRSTMKMIFRCQWIKTSAGHRPKADANGVYLRNVHGRYIYEKCEQFAVRLEPVSFPPAVAAVTDPDVHANAKIWPGGGAVGSITLDSISQEAAAHFKVGEDYVIDPVCLPEKS
jgi:hypothetical protein